VALKGGIQKNNSWQSPFNCSNADFLSVSISIQEATAPRKSDGTLPDITFMHLKPGSDLIDAGLEVGLPFNGAKPDLGCFETSVLTADLTSDLVELGVSIYPNPTTGILYIIGKEGFPLPLKVYNSSGQLVKEEIQQEGKTSLDLTTFPSGMYIVHLQVGEKTVPHLLLLQK